MIGVEKITRVPKVTSFKTSDYFDRIFTWMLPFLNNILKLRPSKKSGYFLDFFLDFFFWTKKTEKISIYVVKMEKKYLKLYSEKNPEKESKKI